MKKGGDYNSPFEAILKGVSDLFKKQDRIDPLNSDLMLADKTILITGSSSGLGFATAVALAKRGAQLIMATRSGIPEKGNDVIEASRNPNVFMRFIDLSDLDSVTHFVDDLVSEKIKIDVFINNAAVVSLKSRKTKSGFEEMFLVNYLAPFFLINQAIRKNLISKNARVIFVASESHRNPVEFNIESLGDFKEFGFKDTVSMYGYQKMLLVTFANELARRHQNLYVRALCPGPVNSNIAREAPNWMKPLLKGVFGLFFKSPKKACEPVEYFAAEQDPIKEIDYLFLMTRVPMDDKCTDAMNGQALWNKSVEILEKSGNSLD